MRTHTFCGKKYDLYIDEIDGLCDSPLEKEPNFVMPHGLKNTRKVLESLIDEALHACAFSKQEDLVLQTAHDTARLLWRVGYRLKG